jgi:hypothetical protein
MKVMRLRNRILIVWFVIGGFGCQSAAPVATALQVGGESVPEKAEVNKALIQRCDIFAGRAAEAHANARATLDAILTMEPDEGLKAISARFDEVSADMLARSTELCRAGERGEIGQSELSQRLYCVDRRAATFGTMDRALKAEEKRDAQQVAWIVENKVTYLEQTLGCEEHAAMSSEEGEVTASAGGLTITRGGVVDGGSLSLDLGDIGKFESAPLSLTASLICETAAGETIEKCNGGRLASGDKFKIAFEVGAPAYIYCYMYNGTGQFQMFFPDEKTPNKAPGGQQFVMPPEENWIVLDDVAGVYERLHIVASNYPIKELEALRGADIPPMPSGGFGKQAMAVRGRLDPIMMRGRVDPMMTRGGPVGGPATFDDGGTLRPVIPTIVETTDIAGIEFEFYHQ